MLSDSREDTRFRDTLQRVYRELVTVEGMHDDANAALELVYGLITRLWDADGNQRDAAECACSTCESDDSTPLPGSRFCRECQECGDLEALPCAACRTVRSRSATVLSGNRFEGVVKATPELLEAVWRELTGGLCGMLVGYPQRGFAGDDSYDDFKGTVTMVDALCQTYFDQDLSVFQKWLDEGPMYCDDPRRSIFAKAGIEVD